MASYDMSGEDFRAHLYRSLQGKGILDSLKSQLRNRLATELHRTMDSSPPGASLSKSPGKSKSMRTQVTDSMVAEYLKAEGYEYSLSIFLPEAGTSIEKLFSNEDLLRYFGILPSSKIYKSIQSDMQTHSNFFAALLEAIIGNQGGTTSELTPPQIVPQPLSESPLRKSVADKLEALDQSYARRAKEESAQCQLSLEDRLAGFQQDLEARYKQQLQTELSLYRGRELAKVRQEEKAQYQEELSKQKEELHRVHQLRLEEFRKSEQNMLERYRRKEQELESGIYSQRQTLLNELDALRVKEAGLKRQMELDRRAVTLEKEHVKTMTDQLEAKEKTLQKMQAHFESVAEEKLKKGMTEYESRFHSRNGEAAKRELQLQLDAEGSLSYKQEKEKLMAELNEERNLVKKLKSELQDITWMQVTLEKQKDESQEKLTQFGDYHQLKHKLADLQQKLSLSEGKFAELKTSYKEQQQTLKQLQARISQPNLEQITLQGEIDHMCKTHHKEVLVLEYDNKQLRKQLASQTEHILYLQKRLDEQLVQLRFAQREVHDLHSLLEHANTRGNQVSLRSHGKGKVSKGLNYPSKRTSHTAKPASSQHHHHHHPHHPKPTIPQLPVSPPCLHDDNTWALTTTNLRKERSLNFFDSSGSFLAESKATIDRMEKEAEQLERTYCDLNSQMESTNPMKLGISSLFPNPSPVPNLVSPVPNLVSPLPVDQSSYISAGVTPTNLLDPDCYDKPLVYNQYSVLHPPAGYLLPRTNTQLQPPRSTTLPVTSTSLVCTEPEINKLQNGANFSPSYLSSPCSSQLPIPTPLPTLDSLIITETSTVPEVTLSVSVPNPASTVVTSIIANTSFPSKQTAFSLDSWWKKPSESPSAETQLIGTTHTPILSVAPGIINGEQKHTGQAGNEVDRDGIVRTIAETSRTTDNLDTTSHLTKMEPPVGLESSVVPPSSVEPLLEPSLVETLSHKEGHESGGSYIDHPPLGAEQFSVESPSGHHSKPINDGLIKKEEVKESEEDEIDPVMLKYMQLVKENKEKEKKLNQVKETAKDPDTFPLSNSSNSGVFSNQEDNPFEDW